MKQRYFIHFSYHGGAYNGWQIQPNGLGVQEVMQQAFSTILRCDVHMIAAGRTDTGVHARQMVAHVDLDVDMSLDSSFVAKINSFLPQDIAVKSIEKVAPDAHARFDATARRYEYHLITEKNVFLHDFAMRVFYPLDFEAMNEAAQQLFLYDDFTSFSKVHTDVKTNICKITQAGWEQKAADHWVFTIEADRFLRNMVRAIVGTLLEVGRGKMSCDKFRQVIEAKNRSHAGVSVPGKGLFLVEVKY